MNDIEKVIRAANGALSVLTNGHVVTIVDTEDKTFAVLPDTLHPREAVEMLVQIAFDIAHPVIGQEKAAMFVVEVLAQSILRLNDTDKAAQETAKIIAKLQE